MEKTGKSYKSPGILRRLYRNIRPQEEVDKWMQFEFHKSTLAEYRIDRWLLTDGFTPHLKNVYENIVVKYEEDIKELMRRYTILNEGELFCTDF